MSNTAEKVETLQKMDIRKEVSRLNKASDKYLVVVAKMSKDGLSVDYNCESHNFPLNDMPMAGDYFRRMVRNQHEVQASKNLMSSEEKADLQAQEELKNRLELE